MHQPPQNEAEQEAARGEHHRNNESEGRRR